MKQLLMGAVLASFATLTSAQSVDLSQAVEMALKADHRIAEKEHLVDAARALIDQAQASDDLMVDMNLFVGLAPVVEGGIFEGGAESCVSPCKLRDDLYEFDEVTGWASLQLKLIKPLATFGKVRYYTEAAEGNVEVKKSEVREQRIETIYDTSRAYYGYLTARDSHLLLEDVKRRLEKAKALVERWLEEDKGDVKQSDLYALETGMALLNKYLAEAKSVERIALAGLKVMTGVGIDGELSVADKSLSAEALPQDSLADLQQRALANRPEMDQLKAGLEARRALVAAKKSESNPNLYAGIVGTFAYAPGRDTLDNPYTVDPFNHVAATPVVGLKWDMQGGVTSAKTSRAQAELDALISKSAFAQQGIPFDVAEKYHELQALHSAVEELGKGSRSGRRWMVSSYADFEAGLEEADKVLDAFKTYVLTHADYLSSVNDYNMKIIELNRATGAY
ncbi:hypothetical protein BOW53_05900 [Solemya pervernicosa gill symbiont]|uniref:Transporter n=2 Tax=Gammaproteobacteria incertae sedis TaxID=118884 RepID=A0A1T2L7F5_9GAMM|nr:TolC family protein [Candidatus Reidiella endopervernicosa]OOZ40866.1 hypothetical protein BOW53_05900 [Solemya pervernicosa gill symbiont]